MKKDALEVFDRATNPDPNLNVLENNFKYLFSTLPFPVYDVDWKLLANINRGQQLKNRLNDIMFILDDPLAKFIRQDIISTNSVKADESFFNTSFNIESIATFYIISSSFFFLTCHYFKKRKNFCIEDNTS